ncbi:MAG TPA: hypothetical protein VI357_02910 [Mycobacteriales bacterium]
MGRESSVSLGRLAVALLGFAALAFGIGAGIEVAGLGRATAIVAAVVLVLVFVLVLLGGHVAAPAVSDRFALSDYAKAIEQFKNGIGRKLQVNP